MLRRTTFVAIFVIALAFIIPPVFLQERDRNPPLITRVINTASDFVSGLGTVFFGEEEPQVPPYWGPKSREGKGQDTSIRPFEIKVDDAILNDLRARLNVEISKERARITPPLEGVGFQYGINTNFLSDVTSYWLNKYDWRAREKKLNEYPHFKTDIHGIEIHFQRASPKNNDGKPTRPLLLLHGWPSTFADFQKVIPQMLEPPYSTVNFELIIPSLPGYGFSERSSKQGLSTAQMAQIFLRLMKRLGYSKFYVHGADWGAIVATDMAAMYPKSVLGLHMSMCFTFHYRSFIKLAMGQLYRGRGFQDSKEANRVFPLNKYLTTIIQETGYFHHQATKPDTLGVALGNSPSGLAAYILEKFSTFTNLKFKNKRNGGILPHFDLDELLDTIMIYWVTNSVTSSMRLYYEYFNTNSALSLANDQMPVNVPTACLNMPDDFWSHQNQYLVQDKYPQVVHYTKSLKGGHFTAIEVPEILTMDAVDFYNKIEFNGTSSRS